MLRVLAITQLFPNTREPLFSQFNRQQFAALGSLCELTIVAPVPWFPGAARLAAATRAGHLAGLTATEHIDGLQVRHPRFLHVPKLGQWFAGPLQAGWLWPSVRRYRGKVDVVLGAWAYPDGCAAVALAAALGVPAVVKLHGSDMNVVARLPGPRLWLRAALPRAARVVAVSRRLGDEAVALGVDPARIDLVFNGVDRSLFCPGERAEARQKLGIADDRRRILFVGNLLATKGVGDLLAAFERVAAGDDGVDLVLVGDGPMRKNCEQLADRLPGRVVVAGARPLDEVARWMTACDVVTLPSWNEGTPNVVLEALSAGRRVVATDVGGIPDLLCEPSLGAMVPVRNIDQLADALAVAARTDYDQAQVAQLGGRGDWQQSARDLHAVLARAAQRPLQSNKEARGNRTAKSA